MGRVIRPLTDMGARITSEGASENCAPLVIEGGPLHGINYHLPMASAQVKGAVLLAGLYASGKTTVTEPNQSRDHTERLLRYFLVDVDSPEERSAEGESNTLTIKGGQMPESRNFTVPGDISSAAFWLAAAAAQPGARLLVKNVGVNPTRTGVLSVLLRMGAHVHEVIEDITQIEPTGTVEVEGARLHGTVIEGREIPNVIDEIPILAVLGALAAGQTVIRNAAELRVKETDRLKALATNLKAMGAEVYETPDGLTITGGRPLHGARLQSYGDHRIAMAFAIAGLFAEGETVIEDCACIDTSYPGFAETLESDHHVFHQWPTGDGGHLGREPIPAGRGDDGCHHPQTPRPRAACVGGGLVISLPWTFPLLPRQLPWSSPSMDRRPREKAASRGLWPSGSVLPTSTPGRCIVRRPGSYWRAGWKRGRRGGGGACVRPGGTSPMHHYLRRASTPTFPRCRACRKCGVF